MSSLVFICLQFMAFVLLKKILCIFFSTRTLTSEIVCEKALPNQHTSLATIINLIVVCEVLLFFNKKKILCIVCLRILLEHSITALFFKYLSEELFKSKRTTQSKKGYCPVQREQTSCRICKSSSRNRAF